MQNILIFDASQKKRAELTKRVRSCLGRMGTRRIEFLYFNPEDVFKREIPETALAAFFTLEDMTGAEAARKFGQYRENVPLVIVSDTDEFALESWLFGTKYYLKRPLTKNLVGAALQRCVRQ